MTEPRPRIVTGETMIASCALHQDEQASFDMALDRIAIAFSDDEGARSLYLSPWAKIFYNIVAQMGKGSVGTVEPTFKGDYAEGPELGMQAIRASMLSRREEAFWDHRVLGPGWVDRFGSHVEPVRLNLEEGGASTLNRNGRILLGISGLATDSQPVIEEYRFTVNATEYQVRPVSWRQAGPTLWYTPLHECVVVPVNGSFSMRARFGAYRDLNDRTRPIGVAITTGDYMRTE